MPKVQNFKFFKVFVPAYFVISKVSFQIFWLVFTGCLGHIVEHKQSLLQCTRETVIEMISVTIRILGG